MDPFPDIHDIVPVAWDYLELAFSIGIFFSPCQEDNDDQQFQDEAYSEQANHHQSHNPTGGVPVFDGFTRIPSSSAIFT